MNARERFHSQLLETLAEKTDSERSKLTLLHDEWRIGRECTINEVYLHNEELYRCRQTHTTQAGWEPDVTEALFKKLMYRDGIRIIPEVITTGDMFALGETGWWGDVLKRSKADNNIWTPEQYPDYWEDVE